MLIGIDASRAVSLFWGGPENYSYYLIRALTRINRQNRYRLYVSNTPPRPLASESAGRLEIKRIPLPRLWTQAGLALECLVRPPDVLFVPVHTIPFFHRPSLKTVVAIHDLKHEYLAQYYQFPQKLYLNLFTEFSIRNATHLIAVSQSTKKDLIAKFGVDQGKVSVIYEGYDKTKFKVTSEKCKVAVKRRYGIGGDFILFVGTIQPRKNLGRLIEAFGSIAPSRGLDLVLVGKRGWLCEDIYAAPRRLGIEDRVKFLGHVPDEDLPPLMSAAAVFAFPSLYEGFGLAPLEAMACGTPVVLSRTSSLPEVGGEAAVYVNPLDVLDIARGLNDVLSVQNTPMYQRLVEKCLAQAQKFSWEKAAEETVRVFEKVCGANES